MIKSYVGGHDVNVYKGSIYDPKIRKYRGGELITIIPYAGKMLSAKVAPATSETIRFDDMDIVLKSPQKFIDVDSIPEGTEDDLFVVSALYVAACKALGKDTSRLLTIGDTVVDDMNHVIGCINFNRN